MIEYSIMGMGGAQKYVSYKTRRLKELGWNCYVFSGINKGEVLLSELKQYSENVIKELLTDPNYVNRLKREKIIDHIASVVNSTDSCIIESNSWTCALWGELLASRVRGYNFVFLLSERNGYIHNRYLPFFRYKFNRHELAGIKERSLTDLFRNDGTVNSSNNQILYAVGDSVSSECECDFIKEISTSGMTIASIGRLEKPCVISIANALCELIRMHPDTYFNIIFIGSSNNVNAEVAIKNLFKSFTNVNLIMPGFVVPIPLSLFSKVDLFISSSGSANLSYVQDRPTISVDGNDGYAIGVLGYTTFNSLFRKDEPQTDIAELADKVLFSDFLSSYTYKKADNVCIEDKFNEHLDIIRNIQAEREYYDVQRINYSFLELFKGKLRTMLGRY